MSTKLTVIVDNIPHGGMRSEWGLSILAEYKDKISIDAVSGTLVSLAAAQAAIAQKG